MNAADILNREIITKSEITAVQIPGGNSVVLPEASRIYITQMLGNSLTAATDIGMVRIPREQAVAADLIPDLQQTEPDAEQLPLDQQVRRVLSEIYDPEIPVDIVSLGLIYSVEVIPQKSGKNFVHVRMTLTAPGCAMGPHLMAEAEAGIAALPDVENVQVEFVWDPPWNQDMMSEEARMILGMA